MLPPAPSQKSTRDTISEELDDLGKAEEATPPEEKPKKIDRKAGLEQQRDEEEASEVEAVKLARSIVAKKLGPEQTYDALVEPTGRSPEGAPSDTVARQA